MTSMTDPWHPFTPANALFTITLPAGVALTQDTRLAFPAGYYFWSPGGLAATFSVFHQPPPGPTPTAFLDQLDETAAVEVLTNNVDEIGVQHLIVQLSTEHSRETSKDPDSGARRETAAARVQERIHFAFWTTAEQAFRAGYRCRSDTPADVIDQFEQILNTFQPSV